MENDCNCNKPISLNTFSTELDYYPSVPEGKLYCIGGAEIMKKKALAMKMREMKMDGCPYVIIDSTNSRVFISHCTGHDCITAIQNNERIAEVSEMLLKQGINIIVMTVRSELVYVLLKNKVEHIRIVDITDVDIDSINSVEDLKAIWKEAYND